MIHLDTSFLIDLLRETAREKSGPASFFLRTIEDEYLAISTFVECELYAGVELAKDSGRELEKVETLLDALTVEYPDDRFARMYGEILAKIEKSGQKISTTDLLIAVSALTAEAPLVTANVKDFSRVPGLKVLTYC